MPQNGFPPTARPRLGRRGFLRLTGGMAGLVAVQGLAGCGDQGARSGGATTITWQAIPSYSIQSTDPARVEYIKNHIAAFEEGGEFQVEAEVSSSDIAAAMAQLLQQAAQGRAPNVAQVDSYIFPRFREYAHPVEEQMEAAGLALDDWFPPFQQVMSAGGSVQAFQFTTDVRVLYYRKDLLEAPPASWDEVFAAGRRLAEQDLSFLFPAGRGEGAVTTTVWPPYWSQGGEIVTGDGAVGLTTDAGQEKMLNVLRFVQRCVQEGITPQRVSTYGSETDLNQDVVAGRAGMFLGGNWQVSELQKIAPGGDFAAQWGVAPIPSPTGDQFATTAGGWVWAFFAEGDAEREAAAQFVIDGWIGDEGMAGWCNVGGYLPPRKSVYDNPAYEGNAFSADFREHLDSYARVRPPDERYQEISTAMQVAVSSVASGEQSAEDALASAVGQLA